MATDCFCGSTCRHARLAISPVAFHHGGSRSAVRKPTREPRSAEPGFVGEWVQCCLLVIASMVLLAAGTEGAMAQQAESNPTTPTRPMLDAPDLRARQILRERCWACHGPETQEAALRLDLETDAFRGGDSGPAVVPGRADESLILHRIESEGDDRMPPTGVPLTSEERHALRRWIETGAAFPTGDPERDTRLEHWAWQPLQRRFSPPAANTADSPMDAANPPSDPIDAFVDSKLHEHGLVAQSSASHTQLIRRVWVDLIGLPPTPEAVDAFLTDTSPQAWEHVVDSLLASPEYGERWARHWLDIAHYADTHGFERDQRRDHAWRYRDWVIDAFNRDMPYDEFLRQQIAGDVLYHDDADATIASSFLAAGPWDFVGQAETPSPVIRRLARADDLDDMVSQVMTSTCGITIHCARCHDHKLDPIPQREYYALTAIFSGVQRADRLVSVSEAASLEATRTELQGRRAVLDQSIRQLTTGIDLADIVGGGNGFGTGKPGVGIDPSTGEIRPSDDRKDFLKDVVPNRLNRTSNPLIDCVFIPDGDVGGDGVLDGSLRMVLDADGTLSAPVLARGIPNTDGTAWDAIRNGPVHAQHSTRLNDAERLIDEDYGPPHHSMLALHANAAITLDLSRIDAADCQGPWVFETGIGYFGQTPHLGADVRIFVDGDPVHQSLGLGRDAGLQSVALELPDDARFLTLMATDAGNGIGHDQVCFIDPQIRPKHRSMSDATAARIATWQSERAAIDAQLAALGAVRKVYGVQAGQPTETRVLRRGNPEDAGDLVDPGTIGCVGPTLPTMARLAATASDAERRIALADWIAHPDNPLPARVMVNRLWHHHFGAGIVATPSDFGLGGTPPTHPELLDWLAADFQASGWSIKSLHRRICLSETYRRSSMRDSETANQLDASNRWWWRQNPRRLDAESLRDAILATSGTLHRGMHGPGYQDFDYQEEYAPVYRHRVLEHRDVFRRSIYRFVVRTTPHPFLTTLDCPNPATLTPARTTTTTAIQSLAMLNNEFILQQSDALAKRLLRETHGDITAAVNLALRLAYGRRASPLELAEAVAFAQDAGLEQLGRILWNTSEFIYVD
jgi:hypothetical protein